MGEPNFSGLPVDVQERLALREAQYAAARERGAAFTGVLDVMDSVTGTASSYQGEVRATVSSRGLLTELHISTRGLALGPRALSRLITSTIRSSLLDLQDKMTAVVNATDRGVAGASVLEEARAGLAGPLSMLDQSDSSPKRE